jgi:hypothetical protein
MPSPSLPHIVALVRHAGPRGCTAEYVAKTSGTTIQAARKALALQVEAGIMSTEDLFDGERYLGTVYRMREGN